MLVLKEVNCTILAFLLAFKLEYTLVTYLKVKTNDHLSHRSPYTKQRDRKK